jgi:hypothetical protein
MPFIESKDRRRELNKVYDAMVLADVKADGDLNYILYKFCKYNIAKRYNILKNFLGELHECENQCRNDFLVPYEARKKIENGDV